jgi:predicted NACHT family NTPase
MAKRSLKASSTGIATAKRVFERREWTQEYLASAVGLQTRQSIWKFFSGRAIERHLFVDICFQLDLDWQEIADLPNWADPEAPLRLDPESAASSVQTPLAQDWQWLQAQLHDRTQRHCSTLQTVLGWGNPLPLEQIYTERSVVPLPTRHRWVEATELQKLHPPTPPCPILLSSQPPALLATTPPQDNSAAHLPLPAATPPHIDPQADRLATQDLIAKYPRCIVYGQPGAGKTTLLQAIALQLLTTPDSEQRIPLFISLRQIVPPANSSPYPDIESLLLRECQETGLTLEALQKILEAGRLILLLDGLDEVVPIDRPYFNRALQTFAETYPHTEIVITSRLGIPDIYYRGFVSLQLADLNPDQTHTFVHKWFSALCTDQQKANPTIAAQFLAQLWQPHNQRLQDFAKNPLLLHFLCLSFQEQQQFPKRRSRLYHNILELLLGGWDRLRGIHRASTLLSLDFADYMVLLSQIAELHFQTGQYFFDKADLLPIIADHLMKMPAAPDSCEALWVECEAILAKLIVDAGLLVEPAHEVYTFSHPALQEYLTARRIFAQINTKTPPASVNTSTAQPPILSSLAQKLQKSIWKTQHPLYQLANHVFEPRWQEVILLTLDLLPNRDLLVNLLKQQIAAAGLPDRDLRSDTCQLCHPNQYSGCVWHYVTEG